MPVWEVEYTDEFDGWFQTLTEEDQDMAIARVECSGPSVRDSGGRPSTASTSLDIRT